MRESGGILDGDAHGNHVVGHVQRDRFPNRSEKQKASAVEEADLDTKRHLRPEHTHTTKLSRDERRGKSRESVSE
jgi:hypothetical protein